MIGAGKSTLSTILGNVLDVPVFYKSVENNPVLPLFYKYPNKYAFLLQIYFLNKRFKAMKEATKIPNAIMDRSIREDAILFHANAELGRVGDSIDDSNTVVATYDSLLENMLEELDTLPKKTPDVVIGIKASYDTIISRIDKWGREYEQLKNDPSLEEYYKLLIKRYNEWFDNFNKSNQNSDLILIDGDKYDFIDNEYDRKEVLDLIIGFLGHKGLIDNVGYHYPTSSEMNKQLDVVTSIIN